MNIRLRHASIGRLHANRRALPVTAARPALAGLAAAGLAGLASLAGLAATWLPGVGTALADEGPAGHVAGAPPPIDYLSMLFVFILATFIGLGVIGRVSRLLHTPLMSLTNAISAIAVVGSLLVTGADYPNPIRLLGAVALFASMTNIVSGFLITDRMLKMFKKREGAKR
jgi:NAD(P) transhydrogenase subunit alpha